MADARSGSLPRKQAANFNRLQLQPHCRTKSRPSADVIRGVPAICQMHYANVNQVFFSAGGRIAQLSTTNAIPVATTALLFLCRLLSAGGFGKVCARRPQKITGMIEIFD